MRQRQWGPGKVAGSFPLLHGSSPGSSRAPALINSHQRCPVMADKGASLLSLEHEGL